MELLRDYLVYEHESIDTHKKYIGITNKKPFERWQNGNGYVYNVKFYSDIKEYGWDRFTHKILETGLTYLEAKTKEDEYIRKYNTVEDGYNNTYSGLSKADFDYFNFSIINQTNIEYETDNDYFIRVPNCFIQTDIQKTYGLNRVFYIIWILIDRHRSLENKSYITIGEVTDYCEYKRTKTRPKIVREIIKCLFFLETNNYIELDFFDIYNVPYDRCITLKIIAQNFDTANKFTKIYNSEMDSILCADYSPKEKKVHINRENILTVYLYMKSYIGTRKNEEYNNNTSSIVHPLAFWKSTLHMAKDLAMSRQTITECLNYLIHSDENHTALLIRHETGYIPQDGNKPPKQAPNIYVLNKEGYEKEIQWALNKMMEIYNVDHFITKKNDQ